jgi:uncharacterized membrane protein YfcA
VSDLFLQISIFIPLSFFIGIAASAIGYTAWTLIVPVLFVMFYAILLMACLSKPTFKATSTAMFVTCFSAFFASLGIMMQIPEKVLLDGRLILFIASVVGVSVLGTLTGAKIAYALSDQKMSYLIGTVVILASVVSTVQSQLFS